jgi:hypothetical protein
LGTPNSGTQRNAHAHILCNASAHASLTPRVLQPSPYRNFVPIFE